MKAPFAAQAIFRKLLVWTFLLGVHTLAAQPASQPKLVADREDPDYGCIRWEYPGFSTGAADNDAPFFQVFTKDPVQFSDLPAVMGSYFSEKGRLIFKPRFPFISGRTYWVRYTGTDPAGNTLTMEVPELHPRTAPKVMAVYPNTDQWPANLLKFYIQFDQPMRSGHSVESIKLYDENDREVKAPFLDMAQELWDDQQQRLTVWFDPGRIKSLLIPNQRMGPPLLPGKVYRLVLKKGWPAANGLALAEDVVKVFQTESRDEQQPNPENWNMDLPAFGTRQPLVLYFPEPLDMALLSSGIGVLTASGKVLIGHIKLGEQERSWLWVPETPWIDDAYILRISMDIEDLAGNNLHRLFDAPVRAHPKPKAQQSFWDWPFTVKR